MSTADGKVLRTVCASVSQVRGSVMHELLGMREQVHAFNLVQGIRSAFLYSSGWLFQWHEGPEAGVKRAMRIAEADPRHGRLRVLHSSLGRATLAEPLQIATTHSQDKPTDVARRLFRLGQSQALESPAPPDELWMQLLAPPGLPGAAAAESALVRRHVVAVTSGNSAAVDLVRAIGERAAAPVTYQRFATGEPRSADVGALYVDLPGPMHVMRLHALSRRSLSHPMVRLQLRDLQCVLLLLGEQADATRALAADVGGVLAHLGLRPALRFTGGGAEGTQAARECLQAHSGDLADISHEALSQSGHDDLFDSLLGGKRSARTASQAGSVSA